MKTFIDKALLIALFTAIGCACGYIGFGRFDLGATLIGVAFALIAAFC